MALHGNTVRIGKTARQRRLADGILLDVELEDMSPDQRWREWLLRAEAVIFASAEPVTRETLARVVGRTCSIDLLLDDLRADLVTRPYELVAVAGGWQHRTRPAYGNVIRASGAPAGPSIDLNEHEAGVLMAIGYYQPVTRAELSKIFGKDVSRDTIARLRNAGFLTSGPRSPTPGAPYTFVTTAAFLAAFGFDTLRDLPDMEALEDAGLLNRAGLNADDPDNVDEDRSEDE